jgi:L-rhamnose mutarotase
MMRYGALIGLDEAKGEEYKRLHAAVWPEVLAMIRDCHIRDYTIYLRRMDDGRLYLFSTFEYHGADYEADMARMAADPATQRWWAVCMPMQWPLESRVPGEWWAPMEEVFHAD